MAVAIAKRDKYLAWRLKGESRTRAAKLAGIAYNTAVSIDRQTGNPDLVHFSGKETRAERAQEGNGDPIPYDDLSERAKRGHDDFAFFQRTYLGRIPIPWQVEAAEQIVAAVESDDEQWIVVNCPPGSGKSTCFTHDLPAWLTVRNRAITGLLGSAVQNTADKYIMRLKNTFERTVPLKADMKLMRLGLAVDAEATIAEDYGRMKPDKGLWAADQFVVAQHDDAIVAEKEPTWSSFGRKGGVLGMRYQFVIWDDLADAARLNSQDLIDEDREWYSDIAESRLEPGGTFVLQGQRLGPNDLYGFALRMKTIPEEMDEEAEYDDEDNSLQPKYHHIVYKAHYDELCQHNHKLSSPAYGEPGGCLLYPRRLSWKRLSGIMLNNLNRFKVVYQQEEIDPETVLVQKDWVSGEGGHIGCWDKDRDRLEVPEGVDLKRCISVVAVDPSPTKFWAIGWWLIDPLTMNRYLIDLVRTGMGANKFLDYNVTKQEYSGLADTMQRTSYELGIPITHWIIETNAAQKFMTQYDAVQNWQKMHGVRIVPQDTYRNKSDATYGVQTIGGIWERGLVRLCGKGMGRVASLKLVEEVTTYPHSRTDDCVMHQWFIEWHLPQLIRSAGRRAEERDPQPRPSWLAAEIKRSTGLVRPHRAEEREPSVPSQRLLALAGMKDAS